MEFLESEFPQEVKTRTVLYHADADGFASAFVLWLLFKDTAHYIPVQYGQPVPEISQETESLYIVDFSYPRHICEQLNDSFSTFIIFDHHITAAQDLNGLPYVVFDTTRSGCGIVWDFYFPGEPMPDILRYVQDRDLWKFELSHSEEINLYISTMPNDFELWEGQCREGFAEDAMWFGSAIRDFRDKQVERAMNDVRMMRFEGYEIPVLNCSTNISEVGNELCRAYPDAPFSASYCDRKDVRSWSLRSIGEFDVSIVARKFGGGGHKNAAGFHTEIGWPQYDTDEFIKAFNEAAKR